MATWSLFYFQVRESPAPLSIPTPTPAPDQGGPVACLGGPKCPGAAARMSEGDQWSVRKKARFPIENPEKIRKTGICCILCCFLIILIVSLWKRYA